MNYRHRKIHRYLEQQVATSPPPKLHAMLLDAAVISAEQTAEAAERQEVERLGLHARRTQALLDQLLAELNLEQSSEFSLKTSLVYCFCKQKVNQGQIYLNPEAIEEAASALRSARTLWSR